MGGYNFPDNVTIIGALILSMKNQVQLITYPDSFGGDLKALNQILEELFSDCFGGIHILPPFPSTADRGFAPRDYFKIDSQFGNWDDIQQLSHKFTIILDFMVNHISRHSLYFQDFQKYGRKSIYTDMFITLDKIWKDGKPLEIDLSKIFLRRPNHPFIDVNIETDGVERLWATFGSADWSEQIDLDVNSPMTRNFIAELAGFFSQRGVSAVRLDAVAYVIKKAGTSCFFVQPEIYEFLSWIQQQFAQVGINLLLEVHTHPDLQLEIASHGYQVYNFVLPLLVLHTILKHDCTALRNHLKQAPQSQVTMLDCHDGIPVQPDIQSILSVAEARIIVEICEQRGANLSRIYSKKHLSDPTFDTHQINITYFSALNHDDDAYIIARAIQFFTPGTPQVYYVGLLAGENTPEEIIKTGERRAINRHNYSEKEIRLALEKPVVQRLLKLIRFRNSYPAFNGRFHIEETSPSTLSMSWVDKTQQCELQVNLDEMNCCITYKDQDGNLIEYLP
jgi:sucrose phosphorylase